MPIIKRISRNDSMFRNRSINVIAGGDDRAVAISTIPVPDLEVICDSCNKEITTPMINLLFLSKRDKHPWGTLCEECRKKTWFKFEVVDY